MPSRCCLADTGGLAGSSCVYGFGAHTDLEWIEAVAGGGRTAKVATLVLPGIATIRDLAAAYRAGATVVRVATHCTEADISEQHIQMAKKLDMEAIGFLMIAHMNSPEGLVEQALLMQSYGADAIYIADSAGAMTTEDVQRRVSALVKALDIPLGVHAHNNLAMAVSNSIAAYEEGAANLDGTSAGLGAGAGNCPTEILAAVSNKYGIETGVDALKLMDVAEEVVRPIMPRQQVIDRAGLILGYAGVYGSFLLHAQKAAERYNVPQAEILMELGRRQVVGGQEDMIIDVALELARKHAEANE